MIMRNDASLRGKAKALAREHGLMAQEVMQMYLFERFLARLAASRHCDRFILKGGLLISSLIGVANRTTMDMDATLRSTSLDEQTVERIVSEICSENVHDGISFILEYVEPIREDDDYGGLRAHVRAQFGRMNTPMKIDLTCGDVITPGAVEYSFPLLFDEGSIKVMSYPIATCVAEKFEAVIKRGVTTTRARDFYDLVRMVELYGASLDWAVVSSAIERTAAHRESTLLMRDYERVCDELLGSDAISKMWNVYAESNPYAASVALEEAVMAVRRVGQMTGAYLLG